MISYLTEYYFVLHSFSDFVDVFVSDLVVELNINPDVDQE